MPNRLAPLPALIVCLSVLISTSCLVRRRVITRQGGGPKQALLVAGKDALIARIAQVYNSTRDFSATVDMTPALGSAEKSRITEYKDVRGYILFRRPTDIRIIGLFPVVRNKAFDMVSNGREFHLYIPAKDRFITGRNDLVLPNPGSKIENLRPQHFLEALLVHPIDPAADRPVLENYTDEDHADYVLHLLRQTPDGQLFLSRSVWFERIRLSLSRQIEYDAAGNILSDARYSDWQPWDGVAFPKHIEINRPHDEYAVVLNVVKMDINKGVSDDKFVLEQPAGATLQVLGEKAPPAAPAAPPPDGKRKKKK